jgi:hypothetical protein
MFSTLSELARNTICDSESSPYKGSEIGKSDNFNRLLKRENIHIFRVVRLGFGVGVLYEDEAEDG